MVEGFLHPLTGQHRTDVFPTESARCVMMLRSHSPHLRINLVCLVAPCCVTQRGLALTQVRMTALMVFLLTLVLGTANGGAAIQSDDFDCEDFLAQPAAQVFLEKNPDDPYDLDPDGNGIACDEAASETTSPLPADQPATSEEERIAPPAPLGTLPVPPAGSQEVILNGYLDGEMFKARVGEKQETIRLIGVDAPDVERWECLGFAALDRVRTLLPQDSAYFIETTPEVRDGEGRLYAFVWYPAVDGYRLLNETLLAEGYAGFVEPDNEHAQYTSALQSALQSAQDSEHGIWGECHGSRHFETSPCETVDQVIADYITANLEGGLWIRNVQGVRSPSHVQVYLVAGEIEGPGREGDSDIGVWWMPGGPDAASAQLNAIKAMAGHATYVSGFESMGVLESADTVGYDEADRCVREALK